MSAADPGGLAPAQLAILAKIDPDRFGEHVEATVEATAQQVSALTPAWAPIDLTPDASQPAYKGTTGKSAPYPPAYYANTGAWGVRLAPGVIALDVDHYGAKRGADIVAKLAAELGPLPPTWKITSRGRDEPGGKLPYRVPVGLDWHDPHEHVQILHNGWRYIAMGTHRKTGTPVMLYDLYGNAVNPTVPPALEWLPELPAAWVERLSKPLRVAEKGTPDDDPDREPNPVLAPRAPAGGIGSRTASEDYPGGLFGYAKELRKAGAGSAVIAGELREVARDDPSGDPSWHPWNDAELEKLASEAVKTAPVDMLAGFNLPDAGTATAIVAPTAVTAPVEPSAVTGPDDNPRRPSALSLARQVTAVGPVAIGADNRFWAYAGGVWKPYPLVVRNRLVGLTGHKYPRAIVPAVEDVITASCQESSTVITAAPVPDYVNVRNGLWNWRTGRLEQHRADVLSVTQLPVALPVNPNGTLAAVACPGFGRFLSEVVPPDVIPLMWELVAYLAYSGNPLHRAVLLRGHGRNGKSVFLNVVTAMLGQENIAAATLDDLADNRFAMAGLFGKLANIAGDIDPTYQVRTAALKKMTGGDIVRAEHKGRDAFEFTPWCVPVFSANKIPQSADVSPGYLARWLVIPFPNSFEGKEDRNLSARLAQEVPAILATALRYLPALIDRGNFRAADSAGDAKAEFARRQDGVRWWLAEYTATEPGARSLSRRAAYTFYRDSMTADGYKPVAKGEFFDRLEGAGVAVTKYNGDWVLADTALRPPPPQPSPLADYGR